MAKAVEAEAPAPAPTADPGAVINNLVAEERDLLAQRSLMEENLKQIQGRLDIVRANLAGVQLGREFSSAIFAQERKKEAVATEAKT